MPGLQGEPAPHLPVPPGDGRVGPEAREHVRRRRVGHRPGRRPVAGRREGAQGRPPGPGRRAEIRVRAVRDRVGLRPPPRQLGRCGPPTVQPRHEHPGCGAGTHLRDGDAARDSRPAGGPRELDARCQREEAGELHGGVGRGQRFQHQLYERRQADPQQCRRHPRLEPHGLAPAVRRAGPPHEGRPGGADVGGGLPGTGHTHAEHAGRATCAGVAGGLLGRHPGRPHGVLLRHPGVRDRCRLGLLGLR
mmetsp:Transcript_36395/g.102591  ORF Transcript_36395/g.102591 Transcript_36395/m.102591 type:complete len:248 (+) Transcript_36395:394-1137(+)